MAFSRKLRKLLIVPLNHLQHYPTPSPGPSQGTSTSLRGANNRTEGLRHSTEDLFGINQQANQSRHSLLIPSHYRYLQDQEGDLGSPPNNSQSPAGSSSGNPSSPGDHDSASSNDDPPSSSQKPPTSISKPTIPEVYPEVLALPITRRPLFPGFYKAVIIKTLM
ncbi:hypothetical protein KEM48_005585 [Puccinia striiformis f. sp. tritici PST-130]|nr:hypothetical protein KEM48_005585 [Puccinia striiformis f. sp. tritici PST-130]